MIRIRVTPEHLEEAIRAADPRWFDDAQLLRASLPANPGSSDFEPIWRRGKEIFSNLQHSKCCFCEKELEDKRDQDVEHFRPKAAVHNWNVPASLAACGVAVQQPANATCEPGYAGLAYHHLNYAIACKHCNETLKKNLFPIEGQRRATAVDPTSLADEQALLIYPLGTHDADPEDLIEFLGPTPMPRHSSGFGHRRALVTIEIFQLDRREQLLKSRGRFLRLLFHELVHRENASTDETREKADRGIDALTHDGAPFANCMRSFVRLFQSNRDVARQIAESCLRK
jgi:hypothetical protein